MWYIIGLISGAAIMLLITGKLKIVWYQWILGALSYIAVLFALQNSMAFNAALEPQAAAFVLSLYLPVAAVLALLVWLIPFCINLLTKKKKEA
jgi:hypothetical protein